MRARIDAFHTTRLGGARLPSDLEAILRAYAECPGYSTNSDNPILATDTDLLWVGKDSPLLDHSYLNARDLADPNTVANVAAMRDTATRLKFVLQADDTSLLGYWQPDVGIPLSDCSLFWLDTEGQYRISEGGSLSETLANKTFLDFGQTRFDEMRELFQRLEIYVPETEREEIFSQMDLREKALAETPQSFRLHRYADHKARLAAEKEVRPARGLLAIVRRLFRKRR